MVAAAVVLIVAVTLVILDGTGTDQSVAVTPPTLSDVFNEETESQADSERSVVQIRAVGRIGTCWIGSGVVYPNADTVITNHHVAVDDGTCGIEQLEVWVSVQRDTTVALAYIAEVSAAHEERDLAILDLMPVADGAPVLEPVAPADDITIGLELLMFGYPAVGGDSLTISRGVVSGFYAEDGIDWIKTDAVAAGGSSGGPALDADRGLLGVMSRQTIYIDPLDCATQYDSNRDGVIDKDDDCLTTNSALNLIVPLWRIDELLVTL